MDANLLQELRALESQNRELRVAQSVLEESHRCYADLFDFAPVAYFTLSRSGYIQEVNLAGAALLERPRTQILDRPFGVVAKLEQPQAFFRHLEHCWTTRERTVSELALVGAAGRKRFVLMESAPLGASPGQPVAIRTTMSDITALKEAEQSLRRAATVERELRQRLEGLANAAITINAEVLNTNLEGVLRLIVEQARAMVGAQSAALGLRDSPNGPFSPFVSAGLDPEASERLRLGGEPDGMMAVQVQCHGEVNAKLFVARRRGKGELFSEDRRLIEALASRVRSSMELARLRELESRERARLELLAEASALSTRSLDFDEVLDTMAHLALPRLADCCVVYLAEGGQLKQAAVVHVDPEQTPLLERAHSALMSRSGAFVPLVQRAFDSRRVVVARELDASKVGECDPDNPHLAELLSIDPRSSIAVPLIANEQVIGAAGLAYCRSDRRYEENDVVLVRAIFERAALALENARLYRDLSRALESRDDMLAVVAHDLRNPLSSIRVNTGLLARALVDDTQRICVARQEQAARNMLRLVDDLLDAAALDAGAVSLEIETHDARTLLDQAMALVAEVAGRRRVRIDSQVEGELSLRCDAQRIVQVLGNLLTNAIKFSPQGGVVRLYAAAEGGHVTMAVGDDGPGIGPELRQNLFRRYWKGQKLGTGLGLYIAKRIVDSHGGRLDVESEPGRGATFTIVL
jgi:PAS domain S-box-containing protein